MTLKNKATGQKAAQALVSRNSLNVFFMDPAMYPGVPISR